MNTKNVMKIEKYQNFFNFETSWPLGPINKFKNKFWTEGRQETWDCIVLIR